MMFKKEVWIWQTMLTPHMSSLSEELASFGYKVTYIAIDPITDDRVNTGWSLPEPKGVRVIIESCRKKIYAMIDECPLDTIHICQGVRGNGAVKSAINHLMRRRRCYWIVMETVDLSGFSRHLKYGVYRVLLNKHRDRCQGFLAIGWRTADWLIKLGVPDQKVHKFAYFLPNRQVPQSSRVWSRRNFKFLYVGQIYGLKRLDWLIKSLADSGLKDIELLVVGDGPDRRACEQLAASLLPGKAKFLGTLAMETVPEQMADADCLVLPSKHDGWGAVASEAMIVGTRVICSDSCGVSEAVLASGVGMVFDASSRVDLTQKLIGTYQQRIGSQQERRDLQNWATALTSKKGAAYLNSIFEWAGESVDKPSVPWKSG